VPSIATHATASMTVDRSIDYWSFFFVPLAVKSAVANGKTDRVRETRSIVPFNTAS